MDESKPSWMEIFIPALFVFEKTAWKMPRESRYVRIFHCCIPLSKTYERFLSINFISSLFQVHVSRVREDIHIYIYYLKKKFVSVQGFQNRNQRVGYLFLIRGRQEYNSHYEHDHRKISPIHFPAGGSNRFFREGNHFVYGIHARYYRQQPNETKITLGRSDSSRKKPDIYYTYISPMIDGTTK